ncbi:MAG: formate dehydrogenase accessory protein FdhE [Dehalococcoidia bacterium]|nr:formate dehydrogenase accessory protein FdhE [Dehalococcoidia bacterium]
MNQVNSKILDRLQEWERRKGGLPDFIRYYREILQIQTAAKSRIKVKKPDMGRDLVCDRLCEGIPLLLFENFSPDWNQVRAVFEKVVVWTYRDSRGPPGESERMRDFGRNNALLREASGAWYRGHSLQDIATSRGLDEGLLSSAIAAALKPFLFAYARVLLPEVNQELWRRRYCPICGGKPDFAYLDKDRGARWLLCSRCDAGWLFQRLECPYCGTQNQDALAYFTDEEASNLYRLYVCEQCRTYIKAIDLRCAGSGILLLLERITTLDMDKQAQEKGYRPG